MGKSIARGCKKKLIDQCYDDPDTRHRMLKKVGKILKSEIKVMCSEKTASILRSGSYDNLKNFTWDKLLQELRVHAPVLTDILHSCTSTKNPNPNRMAIIGFCAALLLKQHCPRMSLLQKIVMLILHAGHCGKQVFVLLLLFCYFFHKLIVTHASMLILSVAL